MKSNYLIILLQLVAYFLLGSNAVTAQAVIPDNPTEVRTLADDFTEDYLSDEYIYEREPSFLSKVKSWLGSLIMSLFSVTQGRASGILENIFYVLLILILGGVLLYIIKIVVDKDIRWIFNKNKNIKSDLDFTDEESIVQADLLQLIKEAVANNDYRTAVRYYYLHTLKKLDNSAIIKYDVQKTTIDYQLELEGSKYGNLFSKAAYYYTYIWYGEFQITEQEYQTTSKHYNELLNSIGNE